MVEKQGFEHRVLIELDNPSIEVDDLKCKKCKLCQKTCSNEMAVYDHYDWEKTGHNAICINCGQCVTACPFGAITVKRNIDDVYAAINDPKKKVVFITAPAVRVGLGDAFGLPLGSFVEKNMVTAIRSLGADFVLDVVAGADLTIMEEANELVERIKNKNEHKWPMFTSCCPAWVKYCETYFPELIPNLSSAKSPIAMQASIIKTYFAKNVGIDKADLYVVAVAPCTAKKAERLRPELNASGAEHDCDCTITTVELAQMIKEKGLDFSKDDNGEFDSIFGYGSSSGLIFGNTGGVMQAALRTGFYMLTGRNMNEDELTMLDPIRTIDNLKIGEVDIDGIKLRVAAVSQMSEARKLIESIKNKEIELDFVEVMACRGGCANGGGQPKILRKPMMEEARVNRNKNLYSTDTKEQKLRFCHESPVIKELYDTYLEKPGSHLAHELLHTTFVDRSKDLGE